MERRKEEKILWIDSQYMESGGTTNNFYYNIGNILYHGNYKKLSVQLIDCVISKNFEEVAGTGLTVYVPIPFYTTNIKIYINLNVASNSLINNNYGLLLGLIPGDNESVRLGAAGGLSTFDFSSLGSCKLNNNKIKYNLKDIPTGMININIIGNNNYTGTYLDEFLKDVLFNNPSNLLLCLKFTYEF